MKKRYGMSLHVNMSEKNGLYTEDIYCPNTKVSNVSMRDCFMFL